MIVRRPFSTVGLNQTTRASTTWGPREKSGGRMELDRLGSTSYPMGPGSEERTTTVSISVEDVFLDWTTENLESCQVPGRCRRDFSFVTHYLRPS